MSTLHFRYQFYAVGQGLFSTGTLYSFPGQTEFQWVFDCGSASKVAHLRRELDLHKSTLGNHRIDLFCLSHFDEDHVNGARELLSRCRIEKLVIPYIPFLERIRIALAASDASDDYLTFLIDPVGYLYSAANDNIGEIIIIRGAPPSGDSGNELGSFGQPSGSPNEEFRLSIPDSEPREQLPDEDLRGVSSPNPSHRVRTCTHSKGFHVNRGQLIWEFLFYNKDAPPPFLAALVTEVTAIIRQHRRTDGSYEGTGLLRALKPVYARHFGSSSVAKNRISLIAYSGPAPLRCIREGAICACIQPIGVSTRFPHCYGHFPQADFSDLKLSIGYFGDFPLTTPDCVQKVRDHFGTRRWQRLRLIQVPHHGSSHSWYDGAAAEFSHEMSIFSSARNSAHHPSQSVLDDLSTHGPVLVNELQRFSLSGTIWFEIER